MKKSPLLSALALTMLFLSACSKSKNTNPAGPSGAAKYPSTMTMTDAAGRRITTYEYNDKNQLIGYSTDAGYKRDFSTAMIVEIVPSLTFTAKSTWMFENLTDKSVYEGGSVGRMIWEATYTQTNGSTQTLKRGIPTFTSTADGRRLSDGITLYVPGNTTQSVYSYDDNKNLEEIEFFETLNPGRPFNRIKVTGYDDKPSPFSAVRGYQWFSYPQLYPVEYAFAFCLNNPAKIITESFDPASSSFKLSEQEEFSYTYDADGYPTTINVNTTYFGATTVRNSATYVIAYK